MPAVMVMAAVPAAVSVTAGTPAGSVMATVTIVVVTIVVTIAIVMPVAAIAVVVVVAPVVVGVIRVVGVTRVVRVVRLLGRRGGDHRNGRRDRRGWRWRGRVRHSRGDHILRTECPRGTHKRLAGSQVEEDEVIDRTRRRLDDHKISGAEPFPTCPGVQRDGRDRNRRPQRVPTRRPDPRLALRIDEDGGSGL
ncbi:MAG: hypothetical protein QOI75_2895, partial [Pseudonocardiales bacterium]|nr:hypothetical protein [Pseudonocardiales bacterium]